MHPAGTPLSPEDARRLVEGYVEHYNNLRLNSAIGTSPELDRLVLACLAKRPEERPNSATDLDRMLAQIEIEPWTEEDATGWWRTNQPA